MKLSKIVLGVSLALGMVSFANADSGHGTVSFTGSIIDAPCSIDPQNVDQTVELGQISTSALENSGQSTPQNFTIKLTNCNVATLKSVSAKFTGAEGMTKGLLGITGTAKGASIGITDGAGKVIALNTATDVQNLQNGDHNLTFAAYLQGDGKVGDDDVTIVPGEFKGVTNFTLAYL
ncbi:Fimbria A protein precursor [Serratia fonticola]|uniref:fimbrial protein n=1 Tax=Serratia fonticola TaxID=47917 RepID=UPI0021771092|nr:fimbrial protein [Serratia fonticola]CAI1948726.1 Fimbria A protein precursor [Serratia fonticola]